MYAGSEFQVDDADTVKCPREGKVTSNAGSIVVTFELFELYYWLELYELYYRQNEVHEVVKLKK